MSLVPYLALVHKYIPYFSHVYTRDFFSLLLFYLVHTSALFMRKFKFWNGPFIIQDNTHFLTQEFFASLSPDIDIHFFPGFKSKHFPYHSNGILQPLNNSVFLLYYGVENFTTVKHRHILNLHPLLCLWLTTHFVCTVADNKCTCLEKPISF